MTVPTTKKGVFSSSNPNTKLENFIGEDAWKHPNYWVDKPYLLISKIKIEVEKIIADEFKKNGRVSIRQIYSVLMDKPYGFMPCNLSVFVLAFVLKEYAVSSFTYTDGLTNDVMSTDKLRLMIDEVIKLQNTPNPRYKDKFIVTMTPEERKFSDVASDVFGIQRNLCTSIEQTRERIRDKMKGLSFPIWCLKYILDTENLKTEKDIMVELIDGFSDIANSGAASKKTDSDIAISIGALCIEHEDASDDLKSILSSAKCKEGMDAYLHQFEDGELVKLAEIVSDNGQYINRLRKKFDADAANWVWNKETADQKIREVILEYRIIVESNKVNPRALTFDNAVQEWCTKCKTIRMSYLCAENYWNDLKGFMSQLYNIKKSGSLPESQRENFLNQLTLHANDFVSYCSIITENEHVKILTRISVDISIKDQMVSFSLPDFSLTNAETIIEPDVWAECKDELVKGNEIWGVVELGYRLPSTSSKLPGKIKLVSFTDFCPYTVDLDYYKELRAEFDIHEWIDILLGAIDYNASGYADEDQKRAVLTRLLPFVEKRLNLIELAPPGTGKSYIFGSISKYGNLSAGYMTRAKLFYDLSKRQPGLVYNNDYVAFDEVHKLRFQDEKQMGGSLQTYMENGKVSIPGHDGTADAGMILLGNIEKKDMDETMPMFDKLPALFHDSAMVDRFHGFIKGWDIPPMTNAMKISGWGLNSEYFCTIMHLLRDDPSYRVIVDKLVEVPGDAYIRHVEAVKRITTAYLKLFFPHVRSAQDVNVREFTKYCLRPAIEMRKNIWRQLAIMDPAQYRKEDREMPAFTVRDLSNEN